MMWLVAALILSAALSSLHIWGLTDFLYWRYMWYDVMMHFLGGLALGTFIVGFFNTRKPLLFIVAGAALLIGWEVFEYVFGAPKEDNYAFDTALDFLMGTLGLCVAYVVARYTLWRSA